jgi:hypothetical protein
MNKEVDRTTLRDYLEKNKDLLAILGVFIAITALAGVLALKLIAVFISFFSFTCATIILIEFWRQPAESKGSLLISFFRFALSFLALSFFAYWFTIADGFYPDIVFFIATLVFAALIAIFIRFLKKKFGWAKRIFNFDLRAVRILFTIVAMLISLFCARILANKIDAPVFKAVVWIAVVSSKIQGPIQ